MRLSAADRARIAAATADQFLLAAELGRVHEGWQPQLFPLGTAVHIMGTHRLGESEATSVADGDGRVWGHENLYVAGNGVLSEYNACNPTLTTVAVALRTADAVTGRVALTSSERGVSA
jgi:choline dehydrogenase-like flavoprotein